jgi:hypothetical protein
MDDLNRFLSLHNVPSDLRRRLREYLHQTRHLQVAASSRELLSLLSPQLQVRQSAALHAGQSAASHAGQSAALHAGRP